MNKAIFIKDLNYNNEFRQQSLYRLEPLYKEFYQDPEVKDRVVKYVIVSAIDQLAELKQADTELIHSLISTLELPPETYIFEADENGNTLDFGELPGSFKGSMDHKQALEGLGYSIFRENNKNPPDLPTPKPKTRFELLIED